MGGQAIRQVCVEPEEKGPLTWPEGNGWIAARLIEKLRRYLRTGDVVYRVARNGATRSAFSPGAGPSILRTP